MHNHTYREKYGADRMRLREWKLWTGLNDRHGFRKKNYLPADPADSVSQRVVGEKGTATSPWLRFAERKDSAVSQEDFASLPVYFGIQGCFWAVKVLGQGNVASSQAALLPLSDSAGPLTFKSELPSGLLPRQHHHHQVPQQPSSSFGCVKVGGAVQADHTG